MKNLLGIVMILSLASCASNNAVKEGTDMKEAAQSKATSVKDKMTSTATTAMSNFSSKLLNSKSVVKKVQTQLNNYGLNVGPADGVLGPMTKNALAKFQKDKNIDVTGSVTNETVDSMKIAKELIQ